MRLRHFEAFRPVCPRCLHTRGAEVPVAIADRAVTAPAPDGTETLVHGILHCTDHSCWAEFPVLDGAAILTADPGEWLRVNGAQMLARDDLPETLTGLIGDALGPGDAFDVARHQLGLYAGAHFPEDGDWPLGPVLTPALEIAPEGLRLDLGAAVGRGTLELAGKGSDPALGAELNPVMLRFAHRMLTHGHAHWPARRSGLVFERHEARFPDSAARQGADLWAMDALALPLRPGTAALVAALNLLDCVAGPVNLIAEIARVLAPGGVAVLCSPYDWSAAVADPAMWIGGHSQRGPERGDSRAILRRVLAAHGLEIQHESDHADWELRLHDRARMTYDLHAVTVRKPL